ncbi:MAG TPA: hypothetical protein DEP35_04340 [Deltaproteobacteria bacterium]|jgi:hypothetical protein|nr:hypothetical protein [Deltaproteobacteria bacterium]
MLSRAPEIASLPDPQLPQESWASSLLTQAGTALDATVLGAMRIAVDALLMPPPERLDELRASASPLLDPALQREPARFFAFEPPPRPFAKVDHERRMITGGEAVGRALRSGYRPCDVAGVRPSSATDEWIVFEHWMHRRQPPRGTVVGLHGFTMGRPRIDALVLFASQWFARGLDVALLTLPHHGARTPADARFSGERFAVPHVANLAEAVRQAMYEIRLLIDWLRETTGAPVGLLGVSLGGYLSALAASLWDDLDFVVPMVPPVCMGDLAWRFFLMSRRYRGGLPPAFSQQELRASFRVHSPLAHPLRVPRERALIVAGRGDRIVPPEHPHALWEHWGRPSIHWFSGGHLTPFGRGRIVEAIDLHLERLGVL